MSNKLFNICIGQAARYGQVPPPPTFMPKRLILSLHTPFELRNSIVRFNVQPEYGNFRNGFVPFCAASFFRNFVKKIVKKNVYNISDFISEER